MVDLVASLRQGQFPGLGDRVAVGREGRIDDAVAGGVVGRGALRAVDARRPRPGDLVGLQEFITKRYQPFVSAFPDLKVEVEGTVSEGDQVVVRWIATATHSGEGLGMAPTGRQVRFPGMTWIRFENGKMMEGQDGWNIDGLLASLKDGMAAFGETVAVQRMRYDRRYAFERIALAHGLSDPVLRRVALMLFEIYNG